VQSKLVSSPSLPRTTVSPSDAATVVGFYDKVCPKAEAIVRSVVHKRYLIDRSITPALLRMLFHDAFVRVKLSMKAPVIFFLFRFISCRCMRSFCALSLLMDVSLSLQASIDLIALHGSSILKLAS
jgi:hypothetical protein